MMSGCKSSKKGRQREQLIGALLQQPSLEKAAGTTGMSRSTAYRISRSPEFNEEYLAARRAAVAQSSARLQQGSSAAASVLLKVMLDQGNPAATRVRAAECVLERSAKFLELELLELRIEQLERGTKHQRANQDRPKVKLEVPDEQ